MYQKISHFFITKKYKDYDLCQIHYAFWKLFWFFLMLFFVFGWDLNPDPSELIITLLKMLSQYMGYIYFAYKGYSILTSFLDGTLEPKRITMPDIVKFLNKTICLYYINYHINPGMKIWYFKYRDNDYIDVNYRFTNINYSFMEKESYNFNTSDLLGNDTMTISINTLDHMIHEIQMRHSPAYAILHRIKRN